MFFAHRRVVPIAAILSMMAGCATGVPTGGDTPPPTTDASAEGAVPDAAEQPDAANQPEGSVDAATQDASGDVQEASVDALLADAEDGADGGCPDGWSGPECTDCATGYHLCGAACEPDGANDPATGCAKGCGDPCPATSHELALCSLGGQCETTCTTGYEGVACSTCSPGFEVCGADCVASCTDCPGSPYDCSGTCVASCRSDCSDATICGDSCVTSCAACTGKPASCATTNSCVSACSACSGQCVDCPPGQHACGAECHDDAIDDPAHGCKNTCDDLPCHEPANGTAVCVSGVCDITCNTAGGFQESQSGTECVCDTAHGFEEDPVLHVCVCPQGTKSCNQQCVDATDPLLGCAGAICSPCTLPAHAILTTCTGSGGTCSFVCDTANGYTYSSDGTSCVCPSGTVDTGSACVCPANTKACNGTCVSSTIPANGCSGTSCTACPQPAHAIATSCAGAGGTCAFTCDSANGYVVSGSSCVCPANMVDSGTKCVCATGFKDCSGTCVSTSAPQTGCSAASCTACSEPLHATASCSGVGTTCDFACDAAGHWVRSGSACVCDPAGYWVESGGQCVCDAAAHRVASGSQCVCDSAAHWIDSGGTCTCAPGYVESGGTCVSTCPGTINGSSCYWYVGSAATFDAAEAACAAQSGHLASVADSAENAFVNSLAGADFWFGLRDLASGSTSIYADDCTSNVWLNEAGGTWTGSNSVYDDVSPSCVSYDSTDDIVSLTVSTGTMFVFNTVRSDYDTVLALYTRATGSGYTGCVGSSLACDDDSAGSSRSLIARYLAPGSYVLVIDGYNGDYGSYVLDVRRFQFTDGTPHAWAAWSSQEPNNSGGSERCAEMVHSAGTWNDLSCSSSLPYVCERPM